MRLGNGSNARVIEGGLRARANVAPEHGTPSTKRSSMAGRHRLRIALHYAVLLLIGLVCVFPFLWTLSVALGTEGNVFAFPSSLIPHAVSLANFIEVFRVIDLGRYFWNSIWITFWTVVWTILVCSLAAYPLARYRFRGRQLVTVLAVEPFPARAGRGLGIDDQPVEVEEEGADRHGDAEYARGDPGRRRRRNVHRRRPARRRGRSDGKGTDG